MARQQYQFENGTVLIGCVALQLSKQVEDDQRARRDNELKISMLEQV